MNTFPLPKGWSRRICAVWKEHTKGYLATYRLGIFKPIIQEHGLDCVCTVLEYYLKITGMKYLSPGRFSETFGKLHQEAIRKPEDKKRFDNPSRQ